MSALATTHPTLLDLANAMDPNNQIARIIEILNQDNEILDDAVAIEGNLPTGHQTVARTGIPTPTWRKMYGGVQPTKSTTAKVVDTCGMLEAYAEVDKALADLNGQKAAWMLSQHLPHLEGFKQEVAQTLFYGNEGTEPEAFTGLAPRYNALSGVESSQNVISAGGDTGLTSIWLINWGPNSLHLIYPQGSKGGLQYRDLGEQTAENIDGSNGRAQIYRTHYRWDVGLSVPDWRYAVRIANIKVASLTKNAASGADLIDLMTQALETIQSVQGGRTAFYCGRTVRSFLRRQITNKVASSTLTMEDVAGRRAMTFDGVPVRRCDQLTITETAVA